MSALAWCTGPAAVPAVADVLALALADVLALAHVLVLDHAAFPAAALALALVLAPAPAPAVALDHALAVVLVGPGLLARGQDEPGSADTPCPAPSDLPLADPFRQRSSVGQSPYLFLLTIRALE
jgi:hypothetical protein